MTTTPPRLTVGTRGPDWSSDPLTRTDFVRYAGASGDMNPVHHDDTIAQAIGNPSVFAHGMLTAGLLSSYLVDWLGVGTLRSFKVRFREKVLPADVLTCQAEVTDVAAGNDGKVATIACSVVREDGSVAIEGTATAACAP
ncbi:MAG: hypothetical protein IT198_04010 [Acidimicrobiia bacterium]|nr:hypothetical protein [Acidimicrobiia bacterium]